MRLLLIRDDREDAIDDVLMIVPDDYDPEMAKEEAAFGSCAIVGEWDLFAQKRGSDFEASEYRPYIG